MTTDTYFANGNEIKLFEQAYRRRIAVMLTGPTGCGKTRLVEHMGLLLGRPVVTISCHDDLTSSDLVGRFMVTGTRSPFSLMDRSCSCVRTTPRTAAHSRSSNRPSGSGLSRCR